MKSSAWNALTLGTGVLAAVGTKKLVAAVWPGSSDPPLNPADRRISWAEGVAWAIASGVGAGIARLVARRISAAGWERATGEVPPGVRAA